MEAPEACLQSWTGPRNLCVLSPSLLQELEERAHPTAVNPRSNREFCISIVQAREHQ